MGRYVVGVLLIVVVVATAVRAGACGMQQGGTQQEVGKMQRVSKSVDPKDRMESGQCYRIQVFQLWWMLI